MTNAKGAEIICSACGKESLLLRKPRFEGFQRVGEELSCAVCGHVFASEAEIPFKIRSAPRVFTEADRGPQIKVFEENEAEKLCRHCEHYVVNPFVQWCHRHRREVEATDSCEDFSPRQKPPPQSSDTRLG
jgi:hypothetical protein